MRIEVSAKHWGLMDVLRNILEYDHEVVVDQAKDFPARYDFKEADGRADVHISTFPYDDIKTYDKKKPLILYATDPVYDWVYDEVIEIQKWKGCVTVAAEPCYPQTFWPIKHEFEIPFAIDINKFYPWTGGKHRVAVVNRKAEDRWKEVITGATGIPYTLDYFLRDIPFDIVKIDDDDAYRKALSEYDVMFYFSNSPYTIVMFEGMTIGMPMVAYNHHNISIYKPIEKYIENHGIEIDDVRNRIMELLNNPKPTKYPIPSFDSIREKWNTVINESIRRFHEAS